MADASVPPNYVPISTAAAESLIAERTLYRLVTKGRLASQKSDTGATLVDLTAVKALSAARLAAAKTEARVASAVPANVAANGAGGKVANGRPPEADGELAARLFKDFAEGMSPQQAVIQERVPASLVLESFRQFSAMANSGGNGPTWQKELAELGKRVDSIGRYMNRTVEKMAMDACSVASSALLDLQKEQAKVSQLTASMGTLAQQLAALQRSVADVQNFVLSSWQPQTRP